jgi:hypothetical protein
MSTGVGVFHPHNFAIEISGMSAELAMVAGKLSKVNLALTCLAWTVGEGAWNDCRTNFMAASLALVTF